MFASSKWLISPLSLSRSDNCIVPPVALWISEQYPEIKKSWFDNNLHLLPNTEALLPQVVESSHDYSIRKIYLMKELYKNERCCPTKKQLLRRANINHTELKNQAILQAVNEALFDLSIYLAPIEMKVLQHKETRDIEFSSQVATIVNQLLAVSPPLRITKASICNIFDLNSPIWRKPEEFPKTSLEIQKFEESTTDFAIRKISYYKGIFKQEGVCPTKTVFSKVIGNHNHMHKKSIREAYEDAYDELLEFFNDQRFINNKSSSPIDYEKLDTQLRNSIHIAAQEIENKVPLVQITKKNVLIELGKLHLYNHINLKKLPKAKNAMELLCECRQTFAKRSLNWAIQSYKDCQVSPANKQELMNRAGLFRYRNKNLDELINSGLEQLSIYPTNEDIAFMEEDKILANQIIATAEKISLENPSRRISMYSLVKFGLNKAKLWKVQASSHYPNAKQNLDKVLEDVEDFKYRRLNHVVQQYRQEQVCPTRKEFLRKTRIDAYLDQKRFSDLVESALDELQIFKKHSKFTL